YIVLHIESIQTSCGYAVPRYEFIGHRDTLAKWGESKGEDGLAEYWKQKNVQSIDGLPTFLLNARGPANVTS
ncbi:MAG: pyridoxamine 5'-phosphate oxidase family protein, partial [Candidatus Hydrogenedentota bacterium]